MDKEYHTKADLSDYVEREINLITTFFRLTKKMGIIFSALLILSFFYSVFKLVSWGLSQIDPFANLSFGFSFILMLLELNCLICMFPAFIKQEYSLLAFILLTFFATSLLNNDYFTSLIILWFFISFKLWVPAVERGKLRYQEYCVNLRENSHSEESFIYKVPELTVSQDAQNGYAPPIDNSDLFKKKSIYDENIELVDMNKVFKTKNNDPEQ
ncbi:MAG: hypothetical protein MJ093_04075 [Saccharofermentans sp.]|nr:hypothetical protein [Saccharofermentans sp.]